jgi:hypothetical protein
VREPVVKGLVVVGLVLLGACRRAEPPASNPPPVAAPVTNNVDAAPTNDEMIAAEAAAIDRGNAHECEKPVALYDGSITVNSTEYTNLVAKGDDYVDAPIKGLDEVVSKASQLHFSLDYPFEKPFAGVVTPPLTLRRTVDAIRAGFHEMYKGTTQRDIGQMMNKDVTGAYGHAFHAIDDLVIERITLCADGSIDIGIGS